MSFNRQKSPFPVAGLSLFRVFSSLILLVWVGFGVAGCRSASQSTGAATAGGRGSGPLSAPEVPRIRPLGGGQGRIVQVQATLRFVVVDFSLNTPPAPDQILQVYREGRLVGEIKAGRIVRDTTVSADIVRGELLPGDEVGPQ